MKKLKSKDQYIRSCYFRGMVLNAFISLENELSSCLAEFFCGENDHYWKFMGVIGDRMTFEAKRASLKFLMEQIEVKEGFIKTKSNRYKCSDFLNELRILIDERNKFAHYYCYKMKGQEAYAIVLTDFRDRYAEHFYTDDDIDKWVERIYRAINVISNIYMGLREEREEINEVHE